MGPAADGGPPRPDDGSGSMMTAQDRSESLQTREAALHQAGQAVCVCHARDFGGLPKVSSPRFMRLSETDCSLAACSLV